MCGIAGILTSNISDREMLDRNAAAMADSIAHRGPDGQGLWSDREAGVAFAHRRLAVVDLSPAGHQPMVSANGRFVITYNGEIYNFQDLRSELEARGVRFRGHSDTEVMLEAFAAYGIKKATTRFIGMFAIGLWDRRDRTLTLIRDRLGIKPLYWANFGNLFLFGSELKALRAHPGWTPRIDSGAIAAFMRHNYVPTPHSIYSGVNKLEPGSILTLLWQSEPRSEKYWDARNVARAGLAEPLHADDGEMIERLESLLQDAVSCRMVADVPVGAFLSGGVDSSAVVALMRAANSGPVRTYSIGFDVPGYNEAPHAAEVAGHLQTEHTSFVLTAKEALDTIPRLPDLYDEPFADASQIPTLLVSTMARKHVTVALSGDGGDELFAGYNRHQFALNAGRVNALLPRSARQLLSYAITQVSADRWSKALSFLPDKMRPRQIGDKLHKLAAVLPLDDGSEVYRRLVSHWDPSTVAPGLVEPKGVLWDRQLAGGFPGLLELTQFLDLVTYLPDDILTKVDRASMAVGLEARVPLIDHRVVEFAWRLQNNMKIRGGVSKWLLRQVLYRHVPKAIIERPKSGFSTPLADWLRGPLRDWAEALLAAPNLRQSGFVDAARVREVWAAHLSGRGNHEQMLWSVLMLESWRARWGTEAS